MQLEPIISMIWFVISYIRTNIIPLVLAAFVTLIIREYIAWKVDQRKDRIQKYEKLIENIYGPLKSLIKHDPRTITYTSDEFEIEEIFAKYSHEINPEIGEYYRKIRDLENQNKKRNDMHYYIKKIVESIELEYNSNITNLERYRKMREGFWRNLWFHINPFIFNERGTWGALKYYVTLEPIRRRIREFIKKRNSNKENE